MEIYYPDYWVIVDTGECKKVFASWLGGYLNGSSWKLSSGTKEIIDKGFCWELPQESGSVYQLHKDTEGVSGWCGQILQGFIDEYPSIKIITISPSGEFTDKEEDETPKN